MLKYKHLAYSLILCGVMVLTLSCFGKGSKKSTAKEQEIITESGEDYVKVPNPLYTIWRGQPEYVYVPKSQYRPLLGERIVGEDVRVKTAFLERKIARLEREMKSGNYLGGGAGGIAIPPNRVMKKKVVILPAEDQTDSLTPEERKFFTNALSQALLQTKRATIEGPTVLKTYKNQEWWAKGTLDEDLLAQAGAALGIQAFLKVKINRLEIIHQLNASKEDYRVTTTFVLFINDGLSGRNIYKATLDVSPDEIKSCQTSAEAEKAVLTAAAKKISQTVLPQLSKLEWFTHIVRVDKKMAFIQGGRDDGLYIGDLLNIYDKPGKEIFNQLTGEFLGREPGHFKGRLQVVEFFGINAAITRPLLGEGFKVGDFVKLAR